MADGLTSDEKARAWEYASRELLALCRYDYRASERIREHVREVVIPSLRRRAEIIRRNAKGARRG